VLTVGGIVKHILRDREGLTESTENHRLIVTNVTWKLSVVLYSLTKTKTKIVVNEE